MRRNPWLLPLLLLAGLALSWWLNRAGHTGSDTPLPAPAGQQAPASRIDAPQPRVSRDARLPREALDTIALIQRGGPFPHRQDGATFGNREGRLPRQPRGWYREYTVDTPGLSHRGARRIVTGGNPPREWYYTDDHYDSFRRIEVQP